MKKNKVWIGVGSLALSFLLVLACTDDSLRAKLNIVFKDNPPKEGVIAKVAGENVTTEEAVGDQAMKYYQLKKKLYDFLRDRIEQTAIDRYLKPKAKKADMSVDEYIDEKIMDKELKISEKDYKSFIEEKGIPKSRVNAQLKKKIQGFLKEKKKKDLVKKHVAGLTEDEPIEVYLDKPKPAIDVKPGKNSPQMGDKDAPVEIVEFSDFQCPFCQKASDTIYKLKEKYGDKIHFSFRHFPLPNHSDAKPAANAAMCVHAQDEDKFWDYHDILFENQKSLGKDNLKKYAKKVGVNMKKFKKCFKNKKFASKIEKDMKYGEKVGVQSTPTFYINDVPVKGAVPMKEFTEKIEEALATQEES